MNSNRPTTTSTSSTGGASAESISRRAYELWEQQGRPDGQDLQHWLQAEQELNGTQSSAQAGAQATSQAASQPRTDTRPLQGTRAAGAAQRETKRSSASPFPSEKVPGAGNGRQTAVAARK